MLTIRKVYKTAHWIPLGLTKGYSRVNRQERDFFIPNERPKAVVSGRSVLTRRYKERARSHRPRPDVRFFFRKSIRFRA